MLDVGNCLVFVRSVHLVSPDNPQGSIRTIEKMGLYSLSDIYIYVVLMNDMCRTMTHWRRR